MSGPRQAGVLRPPAERGWKLGSFTKVFGAWVADPAAGVSNDEIIHVKPREMPAQPRECEPAHCF